MAETIKMLPEIKFATRQRLQFIEIMAYYTGSISRSALAKAYGISDPAATKDLKLYNDLAPGNLEYSPSLFSFVPTESFDEVFADLSPATVLPMLAQNLLSVDNPAGEDSIYKIHVEALPLPQRLPAKNILAQIVRAIKNHSQLEIEYQSLSHKNTDQQTRIIEPHALINNGLRWHVRAYNHQDYDFRDFVLSRFVSAQQLEMDAESSQNYDDDWVENITLKLEPHPGLNDKQRAALLYDFKMDNNIIEIVTRRALVGYVIQQLKVDTSTGHSQNPNAYQLIIQNRSEVESFAQWVFS